MKSFPSKQSGNSEPKPGGPKIDPYFKYIKALMDVFTVIVAIGLSMAFLYFSGLYDAIYRIYLSFVTPATEIDKFQSLGDYLYYRIAGLSFLYFLWNVFILTLACKFLIRDVYD
ncbi:MAG: hypothetical protein ABEJ65_11365 [bacterium]